MLDRASPFQHSRHPYLVDILNGQTLIKLHDMLNNVQQSLEFCATFVISWNMEHMGQLSKDKWLGTFILLY